MKNDMLVSPWRIYLAAGTAAVTGYFLVPDNWWQTGTGAAIGLAAAASLLVGVRMYRPRRPGLWWMLATGLFSIAAGDVTYALYERVLHQSAPFPSLADVLYLAGCPLIGFSLIGIVRTRTAGRDRVSWIDATIVATGFGLLSWVFLMAPTANSNDLPWFGRLVALAYPATGWTGLRSAPPRCCCSCWWSCGSSDWSGRWKSSPSSSPRWPAATG